MTPPLNIRFRTGPDYWNGLFWSILSNILTFRKRSAGRALTLVPLSSPAPPCGPLEDKDLPPPEAPSLQQQHLPPSTGALARKQPSAQQEWLELFCGVWGGWQGRRSLSFVNFPGIPLFFLWQPWQCWEEGYLQRAHTGAQTSVSFDAINLHFYESFSHTWKALKTNQECGIWDICPPNTPASRRIVIVRNIIFLSKAHEISSINWET